MLQAADTKQMEFMYSWSKTLSFLCMSAFFLPWATAYGKINQCLEDSLVRTDIWWWPNKVFKELGAILSKTRECGKTKIFFLLSVIRMKIGSCHDNELLCYRHFPKDMSLCFVVCSPWQHLWGKQGREYLPGIEDGSSNDLHEASYTAGGFF